LKDRGGCASFAVARIVAKVVKEQQQTIQQQAIAELSTRINQLEQQMQWSN
jgi:hypothetical protein